MKANEAKHTFTTPKFLCFSLVFASCYKCSQQTRSYILSDFCHTKKKRQLVEVDDRTFKSEDTRRWWKSLGGLKAYPNDSKCSSLIHLNCCYVLCVSRCWEEAKPTGGNENFGRRSVICHLHAHAFSSFLL
jgi:hypothetical protein